MWGLKVAEAEAAGRLLAQADSAVRIPAVRVLSQGATASGLDVGEACELAD
jgi:hypothetical protein